MKKVMVEAKIRVEAFESRCNPTFYGNTLVKKVTEESLIHDYDNRKNVWPVENNVVYLQRNQTKGD